MLIIAYIITGISALLGLIAGVLGCILAYLFSTGFSTTDKMIAGCVVLISFAYIIHPLIAIWLIKTDKLMLCYIYNSLCIALSIGLCYFLGLSISAAGTP